MSVMGSIVRKEAGVRASHDMQRDEVTILRVLGRN